MDDLDRPFQILALASLICLALICLAS
jgi:hypothetical protein